MTEEQAKNKWCPMVRASAPVPTAADYLAGHMACGITVGDTVKVLRKAQDHENGWGDCWERKMDKLVGQTFVVNKQNEKSGFHVPGGWLPFFVLEKVASPPWTPKPGDWVIVVRPNLRAEVLATWGEIAWLNLNGNAVTYGFDELRLLPSEQTKRERQNGDVVQSCASKSVYLRECISRWICVSNFNYPALYENEPGIADSIYLFNLRVLLTDGPILVALTEKEAGDYLTVLSRVEVTRKIGNALAAYRAQK